MNISSTVIKYGDNVDTDVIIPARYLNASDDASLAQHCMEDLDPDFHKKVETSKIVTGGQNFGCGSSREHAPLALKASGVQLVIAKSFARIFFRNSINIGLAIMECPEAVDGIKNGDRVEVDTDSGTIVNKTTGKSYKTAPFPDFIAKIIADGGLINAIKDGDVK